MALAPILQPALQPLGSPALARTKGGWWWRAGAALDIDFANSRAFNSLNGTSTSALDDVLSYTSPSPKMVCGPDGVLSYARHNLALYSGTLTDASWAKTNASYSGGKLIENGSAGLHAISRTVSISSGRLIVSARVKADTRSAGRLFVGSTNGFQVNFDLSVPSVSGGAGVGTGVYETAGVIPLGNGEYRVWMAGSSADASSVVYVYLNNGVSVSYTGDGASGMFVNDVQIEFSRKSAPSTYLATTSAARYALPIDYDPLTGASLGVLIEEQRTNLLTYSEKFDNALWGKAQATVTADAATAPDGMATADALLDTAVSNIHYIGYSISSLSPAGKTYTFTVYAKAGALGYATIGLSDSSSGSLYAVTVFNLATGTVVGNDAAGVGYAVVSSSIQSAPGGLYRLIVTATAGSSVSFLKAVIGLNKTGARGGSSGGFESYLGNGSGIYVWGADLQEAAFATSYIPTAASQVTRAADAISLATSAFSFSTTEGTLFLQHRSDAVNDTSTYRTIVTIPNGGGTNYARIRENQPSAATMRSNGQVVDTTTQADLVADPIALGEAKTALAYKANDYAMSMNGAAVKTDAAGTVPSDLSTLSLSGGAVNCGSTRVKRLTYWNTRKSNSELLVLAA